jgi:hypothetical protein
MIKIVDTEIFPDRRSSMAGKMFLIRSLILLSAVIFSAEAAYARDELPHYLEDRGTGIPSSMFGTYIEKRQLLLYFYYEYYYDRDMEYEPAEFGYGLALEHKARYTAHEGLIFLGYGITDRLAVELEAAVISARLEKDQDDPSDMPDVLEESGLGDVESQLRWRWFEENEKRPELFSYFETVFPLQKDKLLIGTSDWEFKLGMGTVKGFTWGTTTLRLAFEYNRAEDKFELGEYAVEYLKGISRSLRVFAAVEGTQDELELIAEVQLHLRRRTVVKLNCGIGLTPKATDLAPEVGIMFIF